MRGARQRDGAVDFSRGAHASSDDPASRVGTWAARVSRDMHVLSPEVHEAHGGGRGSRNDADVVVPSEAPFHHEQTLFCETRVSQPMFLPMTNCSFEIPARPISDAAFPSPPPPRYRSRRAHAGSRSGHLQPAGRERRRGSRDAPKGGSARSVRVPAARGASPSRFFSSGRGRPHGVATTTRARTRGAFAVPRRGCRHGDVHSTRPSR